MLLAWCLGAPWAAATRAQHQGQPHSSSRPHPWGSPTTCGIAACGGGNHKGMALVSSSVGVFGGILQSKGNKKSIVINLPHTFCPKGDRRVQLLLNS